ncbi:unnamed protein product, partial [Iphiclides podalirius]
MKGRQNGAPPPLAATPPHQRCSSGELRMGRVPLDFTVGGQAITIESLCHDKAEGVGWLEQLRKVRKPARVALHYGAL